MASNLNGGLAYTRGTGMDENGLPLLQTTYKVYCLDGGEVCLAYVSTKWSNRGNVKEASQTSGIPAAVS